MVLAPSKASKLRLHHRIAQQAAGFSWRDAKTSVVRISSRSGNSVHRPRPISPSVSVWRPANKGPRPGCLTAAALVHELMEARDEKPLRLQKRLAKHLLIIDEFRARSRRPGRAAVRSLQPALRSGLDPGRDRLPFDEWTEIFGSERLTAAFVTHQAISWKCRRELSSQNGGNPQKYLLNRRCNG